MRQVERVVINRAYYAIFYATRALLATKELDSSKHSGVIALFNRHFVKKGLVPKELSRILHTAFEKRIAGDYKDFPEFSKEETKEILSKCKIFLNGIEKVLKKFLS